MMPRPCGMLAALLLLPVTMAAVAAGNPRDANIDVRYLIPQPVTDTAGIAAWLRRLKGRYRAEGMIWMPLDGQRGPIRGSADCAPVGSGAGMHCIFNLQWQDIYQIVMDPDAERMGVFSLPGGASYLNPSMLLMGLDPDRQGIGFLLVDNKGLPEGGEGFIAGERATFTAPCVNAAQLFLAMRPEARYAEQRPHTCRRITRIDIRPSGRLVNMATHIEINDELATIIEVSLRSIPPDEPAPDLRRRRR